MAHPIPILAFLESGPEILFILVVVLVLFGGKRMPEVARGLGKTIREFKKATSGVEEQLKRAIEEETSLNKPRKKSSKKSKKIEAAEAAASAPIAAAGVDAANAGENANADANADASASEAGDDTSYDDSYGLYEENSGDGDTPEQTSTPDTSATPATPDASDASGTPAPQAPNDEISDGGGI